MEQRTTTVRKLWVAGKSFYTRLTTGQSNGPVFERVGVLLPSESSENDNPLGIRYLFSNCTIVDRAFPRGTVVNLKLKTADLEGSHPCE